MTAPSNDEKKLAALQLQSEGYDTLEELLEAVFSDSVSPGICMNDGCDYTTEVEPDQTQGWCEVCGTNTVKSAPILAGII
jgi:hypothetical protein